MKKILLILILLSLGSQAAHVKPEKYYQNLWCSKYKGISEYKLIDDTRVDCLTKSYAVEFDFASKWAESVGQALYYSYMTKRKPAVILILENNNDYRYYKRAQILAQKYDITLWYMKAQDYNNQNQTNQGIDIISQLKRILKNFLIELINEL